MNQVGPDDLAFIRQPLVGEETLRHVLDAVTAAAKSSKIITMEVEGDMKDDDKFLILKNGVRACVEQMEVDETIPAVFFSGEMASLIEDESSVQPADHTSGHLDFCKSCK